MGGEEVVTCNVVEFPDISRLVEMLEIEKSAAGSLL